MEVKRLDPVADAGSKNWTPDALPIETAKAHIGRTVARIIRVTDAGLKDLGDPSQVKRVCEGDFTEVIAKAYQRDPGEFIEGLAAESGLFDIERNLRRRRTA